MSDRRDRADILTLASMFLNVMRCPGGRLVAKGYICTHCDADPSIGHCDGVRPKVRPSPSPSQDPPTRETRS